MEQTLEDMIEELSQEKHDLVMLLSRTKEEKNEALEENNKLLSQLNLLSSEASFHNSNAYQAFKKEMDKLRVDNFELEYSMDDLTQRIEELTKNLSDAHHKIAELESSGDEIVQLKDEIDWLREAAAKVPELERNAQLFKRRLEEFTTVKNKMVELKEQNEELIKKNQYLESELGKTDLSLTNRVKHIRGVLAETEKRLNLETQKALKLELECRIFREKYESAQVTVSKLQQETAQLRTELDEVKAFGGYKDSREEIVHLDQTQPLNENLSPDDTNCDNTSVNLIVPFEVQASQPEVKVNEKVQRIYERNEKLMASTFYNMSLKLHRNGVEARNNTFLYKKRYAEPEPTIEYKTPHRLI